MNKTLTGHGLALFSMLVWGMTYISTKVLLRDLSPLEILSIRTVIGFLILWAASPKKMDHKDKKLELLFVLAGFSGVCFYYLFENIALVYTKASNVSVIVSTAPFFTAIAARLVNKEIRLKFRFFIGFVVSMVGISIISFGTEAIAFDIKGDMLAILAAVMWAVYSTLTDKISTYGLPTIQTTRHIFFYGLIVLLPLSFIMDSGMDMMVIMKPVNLLNLLFLGVLASALCFVTWNRAVKLIGPVSSSVYIYVVPVITVVSSAFILQEAVTLYTVLGIVLTLAGLIISR